MASVSFQSIEKTFGSTKVIHGVGFDIKNGEFMVLVGPSGCGKSTLLRMLAGLEEISAGTISIDGRVVNDIESKDRDIAMVFQSYALYPHMTVAENMAFSLKLRRGDKKLMEERVATAAKILNLEPYLHRYPRELSGGQRQRVAMGRAIVRDPKVFLFDEPLSNLDAKLRVAMRAEIKALHQRLKTTTVYVTHDQVEAMTMADRIVVMHDGRIEQIGSPLELYDHPNNLFVAQFIGSPAMNIINGTLRSGGNGTYVEADNDTRWPLTGASRGSNGQAVAYGIRPGHLRIAAGAEAALQAEVIVVEPTGAETELLVKVGNSQITLTTHGRTKVKPGERIGLAVEPNAAHLFDQQTGARLTA
jgi:multiple sugar transport system ATP-binding protein